MTLNAVAATPVFHLDEHQVTVSGISSGGQMAHQLHIAYPEVFSGAGIIAGGPFGCAQGSLATALTRCMGKVDGEIPVAMLAAQIRQAAQAGQVGDAALLANDPVWVFHGRLDHTVAAALSAALVSLYTEFMPPENIQYVNTVQAAHTFPTAANGGDCTRSVAPFIGRCGYAAAGEMLQHLYGGLEVPKGSHPASLVTVSLPGADTAGLSGTAYVYVPAACRVSGKACKFHLALHGCGQSAAQVGKVFIEQSGYLGWAEANAIVLAFPQVAAAVANPYACWDWWGYTGKSYRWRNGAQMQVLVEWIKRLLNQ